MNEKQIRVAMLGQKTIVSRKGGVEVVVRELSERMAKKGISVTCYNRREKGEKRLKDVNGIKMKYVLTIKKKGLAALSSSFFATIMVLFSRNNVVHYHAEGPCAWMWIIKYFSNKRIIATIHGLDWQRAKWGKMASKWILRGEKNAVKYADEIIVLSRNTQAYFMRKYGRRTTFIPNGVSEPKIVQADRILREYGINKDEYILYLGRITPEKGIQYLIDAYGKIKTSKKLVIAGGFDDAEEFYKKIKKISEKDNRIIFTGFVDEEKLAELYSNAYIYVLPSDIEGMPLSLLEAMSYGKCCIVSDIEECRNVIGGNGFTFRKSNSEELRQIIRQLLKVKEEVKEVGANSKKYCLEKFNWDSVVKDTIDLYVESE